MSGIQHFPEVIAEWGKHALWMCEGSDHSPNLAACAAEIAAEHGCPELADAVLAAARDFFASDEYE